MDMDMRIKSAFLRTWLVAFIAIGTAPLWELLLGDLTIENFNPLFFWYAIPASLVVAMLFGCIDRLYNFMEQPGNATRKALILGALTAFIVGATLFLIFK